MKVVYSSKVRLIYILNNDQSNKYPIEQIINVTDDDMSNKEWADKRLDGNTNAMNIAVIKAFLSLKRAHPNAAIVDSIYQERITLA